MMKSEELSNDVLDHFLDQRFYDPLAKSEPSSMFSAYLNEGNPQNNIDEMEIDTILNNFATSPALDTKSSDSNSVNGGINDSASSATSVSGKMKPEFNEVYDSEDYDKAMEVLKNLKFGEFNMEREDMGSANGDTKEIPRNLFLPHESVDWNFDVDYSSAGVHDGLPYKLQINGLPDFSRVETQIKFNVAISPKPKNVLVRLPPDLISKKKSCLKNSLDEMPESFRKELLYLDCYVVSSPQEDAEEPKVNLDELLETKSFRSCNICSKCIKRELKRASRRKNGLSEDGLNWIDVIPKKAIIFNTKEIVNFPRTSDTGYVRTGFNDDFDDNNCKKLDLSARIVCYCRHHKAENGFKLLFVLKNYQDQVIAKNFSKSIMIMDRKKSQAGSEVETVNNKRTKSINTNPVTPSSVDYESSDHKLSDGKSVKRAKYSNQSSEKPLTNSFNLATEFDQFCDNTSNNNLKGHGSFSIDPNSLSPNSDNQISSSTAYNSRSPGDSPSVLTSFTSISSPNFVKGDGTQQVSAQMLSRVASQLTSPALAVPLYLPKIQKVIPAEGPIRGGIEITLLGVNFRPGLTVKFGDSKALGTHFWSESTMVTFLPPASKPGQVLVTFESEDEDLNAQYKAYEQSQIFTYTDDTDRQLIELALQIVGLKMNGKLEDARNIARRIIGNDNVEEKNEGATNDRVDNIGNSIARGTEFGYTGDQEMVLRLIRLCCDLSDSASSPNWQICTKEKQTMLHLACFRGYSKVVGTLINRGAKINAKDGSGYTPLHFAALGGHKKIVSILFKAKVNLNLKNAFGATAHDVSSNLQVRALIQELGARQKNNDSDSLGKGIRTPSMSSLSSIEDDNLALHVTRLSNESSSINNAAAAQLWDGNESDNADDEDEEKPVPDDLPKYHELYPHGEPASSLQKKSVSEVYEPSEETTEEAEIETADHQENLFNYYQYFNEKNKSLQFSNDKMLLFFWVPILILIASVYIYMQFGGFELLNQYGELIVNYIREGLLGIVLGRADTSLTDRLVAYRDQQEWINI